MLRLFSSKIFREDFNDYVLPMVAFENFNDVGKKIDLDTDTYKFCLPVSIGDFAETNVPACFSNKKSELKNFVDSQKNRKAFIISNFNVSDIADICFSGVINVSSEKGVYDYYNKSTTIDVTLKNPILTYGNEGISPRDLIPDFEIVYDHVDNPEYAFGRRTIMTDTFDLHKYKSIVYQAFEASSIIHKASKRYDGESYNVFALFFVDNHERIHLYELIGEKSFIGSETYDLKMIRNELNYINS